MRMKKMYLEIAKVGNETIFRKMWNQPLEL